MIKLTLFIGGVITPKNIKAQIVKELAIDGFKNGNKVSLSYKSQMIKELKDDGVIDENKQFVDPVFLKWLQSSNDTYTTILALYPQA